VDDGLRTFAERIEKSIPKSVTNLELRLSFASIERLVLLLKKATPNVTHIGIDLGAWVQVYSARDASDELGDEAIVRTSIAAAQRTRHETYEAEHKAFFPENPKWQLPEARVNQVAAGKKPAS
jgi:hypothetical protein